MNPPKDEEFLAWIGGQWYILRWQEEDSVFTDRTGREFADIEAWEYLPSDRVEPLTVRVPDAFLKRLLSVCETAVDNAHEVYAEYAERPRRETKAVAMHQGYLASNMEEAEHVLDKLREYTE